MALTELVATSLGFWSLTQAIGTALAPKYGIYAKTIDDTSKNPLNLKIGQEVFIPSSWIKHEVIAESSISTAPTESGGYTSFNKVKRPSELRVVFALEGWMAFDGDMKLPFSTATLSRSKFIEMLSNMRKSAYTYNIITPDSTYSGYDLTHYDYQVSSNNGVTLLTVNAFFQEVNQSLESSITSNTPGTKNSGTKTKQAGLKKVPLDKAKEVDSRIVKSTDSLKDIVSKVYSNPAPNIRSAVQTVGTAYSSLSETNAGVMLKNIVTGIGLGLM